MKVLHLTSNIKFGGSEQQLIHLVEATSKQNITNFILCFENSELVNYKDEIKGQIVTIPPKKVYSYSTLKRLKNIVKQEKIDLIHIHNGRFILSFILADIF